MSVESVTFHGGPKHGIELAIPVGRDDLDIEVLLTMKSTKGRRTGHYTRVHDNMGRPTSEFEWSGYTTPFAPLPV